MDNYPSLGVVLASTDARRQMGSIANRLGIDPNVECNHCVQGKYIHLQSIVKKNRNAMSKQDKKPDGHQGKRYWLPHGQVVRPFNSPIQYDNSTITDELVEKFDEQNPGFKNAFIDTWKEKMPHEMDKGLDKPDLTPKTETEAPETTQDGEGTADGDQSDTTQGDSEPDPGNETEDPEAGALELPDYETQDPERYFSYDEGFTVVQLHKRYTELTGKEAAGRPKKKTLIYAIMAEEDASKQI